MKLLAFSLLSITFLPFFAHGADPKLELNKVVCVHYQDLNDDPSLSVSFKQKENDFAEVLVQERFTSKFTNDTKWVVIYQRDEQVASSDKKINLGVEDFSMEIARPIPGWNTAKKDNATLSFGNGTTVPFRCEKQN